MIVSFVRRNSLFLGLVTLLFLNVLSRLLNHYQINTLWFSITGYLVSLILLYALILSQNEKLTLYNIDTLSILILVFLFKGESFKFISHDFQLLINIFFVFIAFVFLALLFSSKNLIIQPLTLRQILVFFSGLGFGIIIAILKITYNHFDYINLTLANPFAYLIGILSSFSLSMFIIEFLFRGFILGYFRTRGMKSFWIILITSLASVLIQVHLFSNVSELVNFILLYMLIGLLVLKTKSINIGFGVIAGYSSFIILHSMLM